MGNQISSTKLTASQPYDEPPLARPSQPSQSPQPSHHSQPSQPVQSTSTHPISSIRNEQTFPSFRNIETLNTRQTQNPTEHTAYIGEIKEVVGGLGSRVYLQVADRTGEQILIAFCDASKGDVVEYDCMVGNTVLVMYPRQYQFMDGQVGFRIEDKDINSVKIFRCSYECLLAANDIYFENNDKPASCANCNANIALVNKDGLSVAESRSSHPSDKPADEALCCRSCGKKTVQYCSKACQLSDRHEENWSGCEALIEIQWVAEKEWGRVGFHERTRRPVLYKSEHLLN